MDPRGTGARCVPGSGGGLGVQAEQLGEPRPVEADHHLVVDDRDRHRELPGASEQLLPALEVLRHVDFPVGDALGRKKLFRLLAGASGR
jgi:hypothetical protein